MAFQTHFLNPGKEAQPVSYLYDDVNYLLGFDEEGNKIQKFPNLVFNAIVQMFFK